jgi:hypothetical protein
MMRRPEFLMMRRPCAALRRPEQKGRTAPILLLTRTESAFYKTQSVFYKSRTQSAFFRSSPVRVLRHAQCFLMHLTLDYFPTGTRYREM